MHAITAEQTIAIDPQQFAQGVRIATIGLGGRSPQRLNHQHQLTPCILVQPLHQPVVESADFQDGHILLVAGRDLSQLLPKQRHARREVTPEELARLLAFVERHTLAAHKLSGPDRAVL